MMTFLKIYISKEIKDANLSQKEKDGVPVQNASSVSSQYI